ncbi:MAG: [FeFe] hydrogenase H-cluster maturation GTPase HydF [Bacteroidales bacterium]|nr:[FeFe] hydrogenase H-cluster maturation GTPase HydF [Bacteroidales bacterium]
MSKGRDKKPHIGIFGRRNNGKSSFINALTNQEVAIVSDIAGTTTDPVKKSIEISGIGPLVIIDTAGIDDLGDLGIKRVQKTLEAMKIIDFGILMITNNQFDDIELKVIQDFQKNEVPWICIHNKSDLVLSSEEVRQKVLEFNTEVIDFSALHKTNLEKVIEAIRVKIPEFVYKSNTLIGDLIKPGDTVLMITPIDIAAPEGRMILPQVQLIRDILDNDAIAVVLKDNELDTYIPKMNPKPALVVCDSQVFAKADASIPKDIPLTSFSIVLARLKGDFKHYMKGTSHISNLKDGDEILLLESCTHHVSCEDIGRVKIPHWLTKFTGKKLEYTFVSGLDAISDMKKYAMVIQCGGCMVTQKQLLNRLKPAIENGIPVSNYGMTIAYVHGIYQRAIAPFKKN